MNPYTYNISLRIWHPSINPDEITKKLKLTPKVTWLLGERRTTPKGTILEGHYKESYWYGPIHDDEKLYSEDIELEKIIENFTSSIQKHTGFLNDIRSSGGRVEYFIGLFTDRNSGFVLPSSLLLALGELGIDLAFDLFPE